MAKVILSTTGNIIQKNIIPIVQKIQTKDNTACFGFSYPEQLRNFAE
ncbi:hypothetical protein ACP3T3_05280 [Chryseobacterium sp. CBSDS_008]